METNAIRENIRAYILQNVTLDELDNDLEIFNDGLVSSLFAIELMTFIEKHFAVKITMEDLDLDNFKSVDSITQFVECKISRR